MKVLLDTNALLWSLYLPERLTEKAREGFMSASQIFYSVVTPWELGLKLSGSGFSDFEVPDDWEKVMIDELDQQGFVRLPIEVSHCRLIQDLPFHHRDPFDRMLIAQALDADLAVIGSDSKFDDYGVERVW